MRAALDINIPNYANPVVTTAEVVDSISSLQDNGVGGLAIPGEILAISYVGRITTNGIND